MTMRLTGPKAPRAPMTFKGAPMPRKRRYKPTSRIPVRMSPRLHGRLVSAYQLDHYRPRQKSLWVEEAITVLAERDPLLKKALTGDAKDRGDYSTLLSLTLAGQDLVQDFRLRVSGSDVSLIVRCAIRFRLEHKKLFEGFLPKKGLPKRRTIKA